VVGSADHAVMVDGADFAPDERDANHRRVDGEAVHPTKTRPVSAASGIVYSER
jgi:hypothetical protein